MKQQTDSRDIQLHNEEQSRRKLLAVRRGILLACSALLLLIVVLFLTRLSGAWLSDRGSFAKSEYVMGEIHYNIQVNNKNLLEFQKQNGVKTETPYLLDVPLTGAVKIGETQNKNFNQGVTLVRVDIDNHSDFTIYLNAELELEDFYNSAQQPQDLYYLILPEGATAKQGDRLGEMTIERGQTVYTPRDFVIRELGLGDDLSYETVSGALSRYNADKNSLKAWLKQVPDGAAEVPEECRLTVQLLVWSEYRPGDGTSPGLPFVQDADRPSEYDRANGVQGLSGIFKIGLAVDQQTDGGV